jgi:iron complex outermembrane receptor protein
MIRRAILLCCTLLLLLLPLLQVVAGEPAVATTTGSTTMSAEDEDLVELDEVIVYGNDGKRVEGISSESELDAAGIAAYGANTVGDLLGMVAPDVDNTEEGPVILINGRPANGINSVNDLPSESVQSVQVLSPQAAAALGYAPTRRVINVVLRQSFRQDLANVTVRGATAGRGLSSNANLSTLQLSGNNYRNFALRASKTEPLLEAHRDIQNQPAGLPYDLVGNVLSWPVTGGDIDPALSALTGFPVTVLGVPVGTADPALDDFVPLANLANTSNMGRYRTMIADQYSFGVNGNWQRQLPRQISLSLNGSVDRSHSESLSGATTTLLHVPASSPFTPFSEDVGIARYLGAPLQQSSKPLTVSMSSSLNKQLGRWRVFLSTNLNWRRSNTVSERRVDTAALQAAVDDGTLNPFEPLPAAMLDEILVDRSRSRGFNGNMQLQASGTAFKLPAGNATMSLRAEMRHNRQRSRTEGTTSFSSRLNRQDELAFASLQLPLLGGATATAFGMGAEISGSVRDVSSIGTLFDHGFGLNLRKGTRLTLRVGLNEERVAPQPEALTNPVVTIDDYRTYDFIRQETVQVRYITGGNPDLDIERRRTVRIGGTVRPLAAMDLNFNAEYQRTIGRDAVSQLPAVSEDVQAAFPDRYIRDAEGRLVEVDARLVSFARSNTEQLRWGGNFRRSFGVPTQPPQSASAGIITVVNSDGSGVDELSGAGWRLNANFTHTWALENKRLAREGLPEQDLLAGGAGTGSGLSRHNVQGRIGLAYNGSGAQLTTNWKGRTRITAGTTADPNDLVFSPLLRLDLSAFANLGTVFPGTPLLAGSRVTLAVENMLDSKQRVRDEAGITPLRYQPYLINALGRTVSLSLRKTF